MFRSLLAIVLLFSFATSSAFAQSTPTATLAGSVVDQANGLPLSGANVDAIGPATASATTDAAGHFSIAGLAPGLYQMRVAKSGYQTALSDSVTLLASQNTSVTLSLSRQKVAESGLREIAHTSVRASQSLQRSSVIAQQVSGDTLQSQGYFRSGDYLRTMPQVNMAVGTTGGSDTPSPGDDQYLDIRGIGNLETTTLLDGHPIGAGLNRGKNFGYNWESSPSFALRDILVTYGSGLSGLSPYSALGGVFDMRTLDPTPNKQFSFTQGYGTGSKLVTLFSATGTLNKHFSYAFAGGTQGIDGPYKTDYFYQPGAAFDQGAPVGSPTYNLGIYNYDTSVVSRGGLGKLRYTFGDMNRPSHITASAVWSAYWDNKTGNGDQDYLPYNTALALGQQQLAGYGPGSATYVAPGTTTAPYTINNLPSCAAGTYLPLNPNGQTPWGFAPGGADDGGLHCVTPQQYAQTVAGWAGTGTTFQAFHQGQYDLKIDTPTPTGQIVLDGFTNHWFQLYDRSFELPWNGDPGTAAPGAPGYSSNPYWTSPAVSVTGATATDEFFGNNNDFGFGIAFNNYAYSLQTFATPISAPVVNDLSYYIQDVFHPQNAKWKAYVNAAEVYSSITNSWRMNPRLAFIYDLTHNDTFRLAGGTASTQPFASQVFTPASLVAPAALSGNFNCSGLTIIGSVGNPVLQPERAVDFDASLGHRFGGDSQIQVTGYSENVSSKIFPEPINVNTLPAGFLGDLSSYQGPTNANCGTGAGIGALGVNSQSNIGRLLAQGIDIQGRQRLNRRLFVDYDYSVESSRLQAADILLLQNNPTYIVGAQLPGVPMHKWQLAADETFGRDIDVRYTQFYVGNNNSKNIPAYNYGEFTAAVPFGQGRFNVTVSNVFNQYVQWNGLIGQGVPLAMNQYATAAQYAPYIGANATESYGLPSRTIFVSYTYHLK